LASAFFGATSETGTGNQRRNSAPKSSFECSIKSNCHTAKWQSLRHWNPHQFRFN